MTIDDIKIRYNNGDYTSKISYSHRNRYSPNHVFDESESVTWNRKMVLQKNDELQNEKNLHRADQVRLDSILEVDLIEAIKGAYHLNQQQAQAILNFAKKEKERTAEVFDYLYELGDFAVSLVKSSYI